MIQKVSYKIWIKIRKNFRLKERKNENATSVYKTKKDGPTV